MSIFRVPLPKNEPILSYIPGSPDHTALMKELADLKANPFEIPMFIGGKEVKTDKKIDILF